MRKLLDRAAPVLIALAALAAFLPALENGWLAWDDDANYLLNSHIRGLGTPNLRWIFTNASPHYFPILWLSAAVDFTFWGLRPFGYHLTNVLLHCASAALFYLLALRLFEISRLKDARLSAALSALFFAVHPLRVESVAWVSERSGLLFGLFYIGSLLSYVQGRVAPAFLFFLLSLLSKPLGITLPFVLLLLDRYPLRRQAWLEKAPFFLASLAAGMLSFYSHSGPQSSWTLEQFPLAYRFSLASYGLAFYLRQTLFPSHLLPLYMMPIRFYPLSTPFLLSAVLVGLITVFLILNARRRPSWLAAWCYYVLTLLPVLGLFKSGPQLVADRYSYVSCLGWALLAGAGLARYRWTLLPATAALLLLAGMTRRQIRVWHDSETFFGTMAAEDPTNAIARDFLGDLRASQGRTEEAARYFREAITINPNYGPAYNGFGNLMARQRRFKEAEAFYREAARRDPEHPFVHYNLALALIQEGKRSEAAGELREALRLDPGDPEPKKALAELTGR